MKKGWVFHKKKTEHLSTLGGILVGRAPDFSTELGKCCSVFICFESLFSVASGIRRFRVSRLVVLDVRDGFVFVASL